MTDPLNVQEAPGPGASTTEGSPPPQPGADRRTALCSDHEALGARMVSFGGWRMPVQYSGILDEHLAVRSAAGLFDVSHMGEFLVEGPGATALLQGLLPNDVGRLVPGRALYTQLTREDGGTVDDLIVYRLEAGYLLVVNAGNLAKDWAWLRERAAGHDVSLTDQSDETALLALQGPRAENILQGLTEAPLAAMRPFSWLDATVAGKPARLGRTGYTGEDGFEIFLANADAPGVWGELLAHGGPQGLKPVGLGARDTLRLEAAFPLYGHELLDDVTPVEAGLGWTVKPAKGEFLGREVLARQLAQGPPRRLVGLLPEGRAIARQGFPVYAGESRLGEVTSGTMSPTLGVPVAMALVDAALLDAAQRDAPGGAALSVEIRGKRIPASLTPLPFYKRLPRA